MPSPVSYQTGREFVRHLDATDPLAAYRERFHIPKHASGEELIYLSGNSLGLQPRSVREYVEQELEVWERLGVEGHFRARHPWLSYNELLTDQTARLVGAKPIEVVVMNTLTVNLHLMLISFYRPTPERHKILIEGQAFPSDRYAVVSQLKFHGYDPATALLEISPRAGETAIRTGDILKLIEKEGTSVALIMLGGVNYYTGQAFEIESITQAGHAKGSLVGYDLAHAAGNLVLELHSWDVDFAVWCSYKYLNAGPGSLAGCFVHERHARNSNLHRFAGWWGHNKETRFQMPPDFDPSPGAEGWQLSNPPILPLAALRASMDIFDEVGMEKLRAKGDRLTSYLEFLLDQIPSDRVTIITPRDIHRRGSQLSICVPGNGRAYLEALKRRGIRADLREPDVIRVAPVPLYNRYADVFAFAQHFEQVIAEYG